MRAVVQRVLESFVAVGNINKASIGNGLLILLGIEEKDSRKDIEWLANKIVNLRIFDDKNGIMNLSVKDIEGSILVVSQFTLFADTKKGNRPSYHRAAKPEISIPMYEEFVKVISQKLGKPVKTGEFGANMKISLINSGPVTIIIDTKNDI
jgi:D-aminoacyl-tRNA deacylase